MRGLIFNLLANLAARAGCEDQAWEVALLEAARPSGAPANADVAITLEDPDQGERAFAAARLGPRRRRGS
jgi:hypothetical protein